MIDGKMLATNATVTNPRPYNQSIINNENVQMLLTIDQSIWQIVGSSCHAYKSNYKILTFLQKYIWTYIMCSA